MLKRLGVAAALALAPLLLPAVGFAADSYPVRPIRLVVPFPPGGGADTAGRILVAKLGESTGQSWVVDNRGGAAGNIATEIVTSAAPDGYTVLLGFATALTVNPTLYPKLPFNVQRDLQPVTKFASAQYVLVVHPTVKATTIQEFIALAKSAPGKLNYSSAGVGSPLHLAAEMFKFRSGVAIVNVAYKGGGPAAAALLGGEVQVLFGSVPATLPSVRAGKMRALAATGLKRLAIAPELPTIAESGFPGFDVTSWYSMLVPARTPKAVVARIFDETLKAVRPADVVEALGKQGLEVETSASPEAFAAEIRAETAAWAKVIKAANIRAE
ncbi:MAG: tripartite tricarboxylate transporter substrate binding protein [Proteobacteria bacterium]|nr:tripartite tricarboxylate transporter substrate binding protein [Burkholderiales bacterium]